MDRPGALLLVVLAVGAVGVATTPGLVVAGETPEVDVAVDSTAVSDGDFYETGQDPRIDVDAAVGADAGNGTELNEVVVRVGGDHYETFDVEGTEASETVFPDLRNGNNTVRVIVTDDAGNVNSTQFTVRKDGTAPFVRLTEPYRTQPRGPIGDGTVEGPAVTLAGEITETSGVAELQVTHEYGANYSETHVLDAEEEFTLPLELGWTGDGRTNTVRIFVSDEHDNFRTYSFELNATDGSEPEVDLDPVPEETTRNKVTVAGEVTDDVWIDEATVSFRAVDIVADNETLADTEQVVSPRRYSLGEDRRTVAFEESFYPAYRGTYEVTVNATDVAGETVQRSFTFERRPSDGDTSPTVTVEEDRTVVLDEETLFLSGAAFDGVTRRLVVETRHPETGETLDYQVVHGGEDRDRVAFDREVGIRAGHTEVIVRATDSQGEETAERLYVDGATQETFVGDGTGDRWPAVSVTPLEAGAPATASSRVTVRRPTPGETVRAPEAGGRPVVAATDNVSLTRLSFPPATDADLSPTVVVREDGAGGLAAPDGAAPGATVTIQHSAAAENVTSATLALAVDRAYLDARGLDPDDLRVYRHEGSGWRALDTRVVERTDDRVRFRAESPGLSVFSLATETDVGDGGLLADAGNASAVSGPGGEWRVADAPADDSGDRTGGEDGNDAGEEGAPQIIVSDVAVNRTRVAVNESVTVTATLRNDGDASGTYTAGLQTLQGLNRTFVETRAATVPADGERDVEFTTRFEEPGNHTVSVNGTQAGPVVVSEDGGLLSVLSVVPVRLVGMGLGGLVGLGVVLTLVRFVLRRVGGEEEPSG